MEFRSTPAVVAAIYLCLGTGALFLSDVVFVAFLNDFALVQQVQALKGVVEIVLTTAFIYIAMARHEQSLRRSVAVNRERAQELAVLHRVFRHNLRNKLNIVFGHTRQAKAEVTDDRLRVRLETVVNQLGSIYETSEQAVKIEQLSFSNVDPEPVEVVAIVEDLVAEYKTATHVTCEVSAPATAWVWSFPQLRMALTELLDNAVSHNDASQCNISVTVDTEASDRPITRISIADNGPGIPSGTQEKLESIDVDPNNHLTTFGLWTAYWVVTRSGGEFDIEANEPRGSRVVLSFETASRPA
jgi:signal transduction histidine kinase